MADWCPHETDFPAMPIDAEFGAFAFDGCGVGLWSWDTATHRVVVSDGWKELFGYRQDEISHPFEEWISLVHPGDRPRVMADIQRHVQGETPMYTHEHRMRCKNGSYKWVYERGKIVSRAKDGKPLRILGSHTDITEFKQLARRLTIQHEVANVLAGASGLDNAISAILQPVCQTLGWDEGLLWVVDESAQKLRCHSIWTTSGIASERYGSASRELTFTSGIGLPGRVWAEKKPVWVSDVTRDANFRRAALAEEAGFHAAAAFPVKLADRVYAVMEFFHHEILPVDSALLMTFQNLADQISQFCARERAETNLLASEARLRAIVDHAVDGIITIDERQHARRRIDQRHLHVQRREDRRILDPNHARTDHRQRARQALQFQHVVRVKHSLAVERHVGRPTVPTARMMRSAENSCVSPRSPLTSTRCGSRNRAVPAILSTLLRAN